MKELWILQWCQNFVRSDVNQSIIGHELSDQFPKLRLISQRSVYPHIDVKSCTHNGILLCSNMHSDTPSYATAEFTLALILGTFRQIPQQVASLLNGLKSSNYQTTLSYRARLAAHVTEQIQLEIPIVNLSIYTLATKTVVKWMILK